VTIPDNPAAAEPPERASGRELLFEAWLAAATLTLWPLTRQRINASTDQRGRAMVFVPIFGFLLGIAAALIDHAISSYGVLVRSAMVMLALIAATRLMHPIGVARTIEALARGAGTAEPQPGIASTLAAILIVVLEVACLSAIAPSSARAQAIVLATMLSRWAMVPIGYGLRPLDSSGLGLPYEGGLRFREFAVGSVIALGIAMSLYDIVALAAIVVLALTILGMRLLFSRRLGGASGYALAGGTAVCELIVLATLAALRI
jgi:adenosylcobinamide-GDP ribazoletransferase